MCNLVRFSTNFSVFSWNPILWGIGKKFFPPDITLKMEGLDGKCFSRVEMEDV